MKIETVSVNDARKVTISLGNQRNGLQTHDSREFGIHLTAKVEEGDDYEAVQAKLNMHAREFLDKKTRQISEEGSASFDAFVKSRTEIGIAHVYPNANAEDAPRPAAPKQVAVTATPVVLAPVKAAPDNKDDALSQIADSLQSKDVKFKPDELEAEFQKYMDYGVPIPQATRTLLRAYGIDTPPVAKTAQASLTPTATEGIGSFTPGMEKIPAFKAVVKDIYATDKMTKLTVKDETGEAALVFWGKSPEVQKGDTVTVTGAWKVEEYRGVLQIQAGKYCKLKVEA